MSASYATNFQCDEGDDPNWTDFSLGVPGGGTGNSDPSGDLNNPKMEVEELEDPTGPSVSIQETPVVKVEEPLRNVVNFKEVVGTFKIFVSNLPPTATNEQLREMFAPYGTVLDCEVFQLKHYAFVHMDSEASGNEAVKDLSGIDFDGSIIRVQRSTNFPVQQSVTSHDVGTFKLYISGLNEGVTKEAVKEMLESYGRVVDIEIYRKDSAFVHMEEESAGRVILKELNNKLVPGQDRRLGVSESKNPEGPNVPTITIHVKNIGAGVSAEKVRSLFQPYGLVLRCTITDPHVDLLRKAIVDFEQLGDVRSAINELNNFELDGQKLSVKPVFDEPTRPPPVSKPPSPKKQPPLLSTPQSGYGAHMGAAASSPVMRGRGRGSPSFSRGMGYGTGSGLSQQPVTTPSGMYNQGGASRGGRGGSNSTTRGRGNFGPPVNRGFQLVPMPSKQDMKQTGRGRGNFGRGGRGGRGFGRSQTSGNYQNHGFDQDTYDFDEYYQDPTAASSREHLSEFETAKTQVGGMGFGPPEKKPKFQSNFQLNAGGQAKPLMGIDFHSDTMPEQPLAQQKSQAQMQTYQQFTQRQNQSQLNPDYFSSDQIAGSSTNHSSFDGNSNAGLAAYPANYYAGVADFNLNAVPFDYSNLRRGRGGGFAGKGGGRGGGKQFQMQTEFPPGVNPADFPDLQPGSKVYINGRGKVMVRGARLKTTSRGKARRPGLGSKGSSANKRGGGTVPGASTSNGLSLSGANQIPLGGAAGPSTSFAKNSNNFGAKQFKSRDQIKEDNQEYTEWLQQKKWLYQAIPGTVKPVSK